MKIVFVFSALDHSPYPRMIWILRTIPILLRRLQWWIAVALLLFEGRQRVSPFYHEVVWVVCVWVACVWVVCAGHVCVGHVCVGVVCVCVCVGGWLRVWWVVIVKIKIRITIIMKRIIIIMFMILIIFNYDFIRFFRFTLIFQIWMSSAPSRKNPRVGERSHFRRTVGCLCVCGEWVCGLCVCGLSVWVGGY